MAEINFNNLYNQLKPMEKRFYDQQFQKKYNPNQENIMLSSQPAYEQMKSAYDAQQQVPEKSFFDLLNPFSSASAAEMPQVPNVSLGTPKINFNTGITSASSAIPNINGVPIINTGALNQDLQNTDLVNQIIAANQAANANRFGNTVAPFTGNQMPFNDFYGSVYEPYNEEKDDEQVDYLPGQSSFKDKISNIGSSFMQKSGIGGLLGLITGNPILGLIGKGIGALANRAGPALNDFKSASTGAQFFQNLRDRRAREDAAARGAAKQAAAARVESFRNFDRGYGGGRDSGGTGSAGRGGASPGSAGPGGSDSMGSF